MCATARGVGIRISVTPGHPRTEDSFVTVPLDASYIMYIHEETIFYSILCDSLRDIHFCPEHATTALPFTPVVGGPRQTKNACFAMFRCLNFAPESKKAQTC